MDWGAWIYQPGLPPQVLNFTTENITKAINMADAYINGSGQTSPDDKDDYNKIFYSNLKVIFIERLAERINDTTLEILTKIDADLNITSSLDPEVKQRWLPLGITKGFTAAVEPGHAFVRDQGRLKYLEPVYRAQLAVNRDTAVTWYCESINFYHPMAVTKIADVLSITSTDCAPTARQLIQ